MLNLIIIIIIIYYSFNLFKKLLNKTRYNYTNKNYNGKKPLNLLTILLLNLSQIINQLYKEKYHYSNDNNSQNSYNIKNPNDMSVEEARQILGVKPEASNNEITQAFKRLISLNHPDKGGSEYLANKIIMARKKLISK